MSDLQVPQHLQIAKPPPGTEPKQPSALNSFMQGVSHMRPLRNFNSEAAPDLHS